MLKQKHLTCIIAVGTFLIGIQPLLAYPLSDDQITQVSFRPPSSDPKPNKTSGAGSRNDNYCASTATTDTSSFIPLVPADSDGLTVAAHPTFWVYIPKTSAKQVILSITEEGTRHHSQTLFSLEGTEGIRGFKVSKSSAPLEVGKTYQWTVVLVCGEKLSPYDPGVAAWVRRIDLSDSSPKTALQQAVWYGEQGIWYDLLSAIAIAQSAQPAKARMTSIWSNFLTSVGFEAIATQPVTFEEGRRN